MNVDIDDCYKLEGSLKYVWSSKTTYDIHLILHNSDKKFYINRGLQAGLNDETFDTLIGKEITIYPVDHWTLLDPKKKHPHVARVEAGGKVLFSEF
jgi:protein associated with RNAse G/E